MGESIYYEMMEIHNSGIMDKMEIVSLHGCMNRLWRRHLTNFKLLTSVYIDAIRSGAHVVEAKKEREPSFSVIKINAAGVAKVTKQWVRHLEARASFRMNWRNERRNARLSGALYYRLDSSSSNNDDDIRLLDGMAFHRNEFHDHIFCRPEWIFFDEEVEEAKIEVTLRKGIKREQGR
ncbi:hypothetical protein [Pluralibacter gergoviae]